MNISINAEKPGRRRYLTLFMIFITVVICYVDRANLAVSSAHIQEEFGITKAGMGYVFSAFAWLYTLCQIPGGWFIDRVGSRLTYFIAILGWSVATLLQGFATGLISLITLRAITGIFEAPAFPTNNRMVTSWFPEQERASAVGFFTSGQFRAICRSGIFDTSSNLDSGTIKLALGVYRNRRYRYCLVINLVQSLSATPSFERGQ